MTQSHRGTVLVADDEPILLKLIVRILEREGFRVLPAEDGDTAISAYLAEPGAIDVVLFDASMPPHGGASALRTILSQSERSQSGVGVVLTSGEALDGDDQKLLDQCGGCFLAKPFSPSLLYETVDSVRREIG